MRRYFHHGIASALDASQSTQSDVVAVPSFRRVYGTQDAVFSVTLTGSPDGALSVLASLDDENFDAVAMAAVLSGVTGDSVTIDAAGTHLLRVKSVERYRSLKLSWVPVDGSSGAWSAQVSL